jgi:hypothetical protein
LASRIVDPAALDAALQNPVVKLPDRPTFMSMRPIVSASDDDASLAHLVRSAARPGLRQRIIDYRQQVRAERVATVDTPLPE